VKGFPDRHFQEISVRKSWLRPTVVVTSAVERSTVLTGKQIMFWHVPLEAGT
jgi:hypothetical protein